MYESGREEEPASSDNVTISSHQLGLLEDLASQSFDNSVNNNKDVAPESNNDMNLLGSPQSPATNTMEKQLEQPLVLVSTAGLNVASLVL